MTYDEAVKIVMRHKRNQIIVEKIMQWDSKLTFLENARKLKISDGSARQLVYRNDLKFNPIRTMQGYVKMKERAEDRVRRDWREDLTIQENAKRLGVKPGHAACLARRHGLGYLKILLDRSYIYRSRRIGMMSNPRNLQIMAMRNLGMTYKVIGETFNCSTQNIEQICRHGEAEGMIVFQDK